MPYSRIPPKKGKPFQYPSITVENPGKGLNNLISAQLIDDHEASDLNNIQFVESGCVAKATGRSPWGSGLTGIPKGLASFYTLAGNHYVVTVDSDGTLKSSTGATSSWTTVSGTTFATSVVPTFTQMDGKLFVWDGTNGGAYWDGTTLTRPGTMPSAAFSILYQNTHIASGTPTKTSRIYLASSTDSTDFTTNTANSGGKNYPNNSTDVPGATVFPSTTNTPNFFDVDADNGDNITGLAKFKDVLIIFKQNSIYQMTFDSSATPIVTPILHYLGAVSHRSIDNVENDVFYLSRLGWFVLGYEPNFFNIIRTNELSVRIHPVVDSINPANLSRVCALYQPYRFYSSFPSGGSATNNETVTYDKRYLAWSKLDFVHANAFTTFIDGTNTEHLLYAADDENGVFELDESYSNNGQPISAYWESKEFDGGKPDLYKRWIDVTLLFRQLNGPVTVTVFTDQNTQVHRSIIPIGDQTNNGIGTKMWGDDQWGGTADPTASSTDPTLTTNVPYRIRLSTVSRTIKIKVENDNINQNFVLLGFVFTFRPYSHFKFNSQLKIQ